MAHNTILWGYLKENICHQIICDSRAKRDVQMMIQNHFYMKLLKNVWKRKISFSRDYISYVTAKSVLNTDSDTIRVLPVFSILSTEQILKLDRLLQLET